MIPIALVGLGRIGLLFDEGVEGDSARSHAKALLLNPGFHLKYAVDPDPALQRRLRKMFPAVQTLGSVGELAGKNDFEVLSVCSPTQTHFEIVSGFRSCPWLRAIVLEKPAFSEDSQYLALEEELKGKILVNYLRRFFPQIRELNRKIAAGELGEVRALRGIYSKGLHHNGSHLLDLVHFLLPEARLGRSVALEKKADFFSNDPTIGGALTLLQQNREVIFMLTAADEREYSIFELELLFSRGRVVIRDFSRSIDYYWMKEDTVHGGYSSLPSQPISVSTDSHLSLKYVYEHVAAVLAGRETWLSPLSSESWVRSAQLELSKKAVGL